MTNKRFTSALTCSHCGNKAPMLIVAEYSKIKNHHHDKAAFDWSEGPFWEMLECQSCQGVLLRKGYWHEYLSDETGPDYELLYPNAPEKIKGLPQDIAKSLEAAQKVKNIDSNAFAVLLGRVLDMICIDMKANGDSLFERLKDMGEKGIMPKQLADMAHGIRQLRNIGAHADLGELTSEEVPILEALSKAILEYVYFAPTLITLVEEKLSALKKKP